MLGFAPLGGAPLGAASLQSGGTVAAPGHRYWRLAYDSTPRGAGGCSKLEFHIAIGGADVSSQGTPIASSAYSGNDASFAFDNDPATNWSSDYGQPPGWLGIDFGVHRPAVVEIAFHPRSDGSFANTDSPKPGGVEWSDDGSTWTRVFTVNEDSYVAGTTYTFSATPAGSDGPVDQLTLADVLDGEIDSNNAAIVEHVQLADPLTPRWIAQGIYADLINFHDLTYQGAQQYNPVPAAVVETLKVQSPLIAGQVMLLADTFHVAETLTAFYGAVVTETIQARETWIGNGNYQLFAAELARLADRARLGLPVTATDSVTLASLLDAKTAIRLVEAVRLVEQFQGSARYNVQLRQSLKLADSLARFFGADITDAVAVAELLTALRTTSATVAEHAAIQEVVGPQFLLAVQAADGIELTAAQAVNAIFDARLADEVEIVAGYLEPNGSFTTWVMNTRSGAVTEYENFAFNSFAAFGNLYLGASEDGLYELLGDDDDGDDIIAAVKGGYLQFGGTQLSRLKEAYIATTGSGQFVLRVTTKDGDTYNYGVDARSGRNAKVHMGKGMRARYFGWELTSMGQDFDLDTLEFVPIVVQRRV